MKSCAVNIVLAGVLGCMVGVGVFADPPSPSPSNPSPSALQKSGLVEKISADLRPVDVSVWPQDNDPGLCAKFNPLSQDVLEITAFGEKRSIVAYDPVRIESVTELPGLPKKEETHLNIVVLFDYYNLGWGVACPNSGGSVERNIYTAMAYDGVRRMLATTFKPGDRIMIARFMGYLSIDSSWLTTVEEALRVLDRIQEEKPPANIDIKPAINNHWFEWMEILARALENFPWQKDLFLPATALPISFDHAEELASYGKAFAESRVNVHLLSMAENKIFMPPGLRNAAETTGGHLFNHRTGMGPDALANAITMVRTTNMCHCIVYFKPKPEELAKDFTGNVTFNVKDNRFRREAPPLSYNLLKEKKPTELELQTAFLFLPKFENGLRIEATVTPKGPHGNNGNWEANIILRLTVIDPKIQPDLYQVILQATGINFTDKGRELEAVLTPRYLKNHEVRRLRETGVLTLSYPAVVRWGKTEVAAMVHVPNTTTRAVIHATKNLPKAPGPYWTIADHFGIFSDSTSGSAVPIPTLGPEVSSGAKILISGWACAEGSKFTGQLVNTDTRVGVDIARVRCSDGSFQQTGCGCFLGIAKEQLHPGDWTLELPERIRPTAPLTLKVVSQTAAL
ncbi:MAG: hypothetical protein A4E65_00167 [Syntrophorhabdus sp. PtaU1.Bin153]|nr:MAG: hypothetical protein A4E65_00167 [Syntrophorhabdus sp. PtaU1.Bin153]